MTAPTPVDFKKLAKQEDKALHSYKTADSILPRLSSLEFTYCEAYLDNFDLTDAMEALKPYTTGKVKQEAIKIQSSPVVQTYLDLRRKELIGNFMNPNDIILAAKHLFNTAIREEKSQATALKALELIAKISGLLNNETETQNNVSLQVSSIEKKDLKAFKNLFDKTF